MTDTWFSFDLPPFDRLTPSQREEVRAALDLGFYPKDSVILGGDEVAEVLHVVYQGTVVERHGADTVAQYGPHDSFDLKALFDANDANAFLAAQDTLCHLVPRALVLDLGRRHLRHRRHHRVEVRAGELHHVLPSDEDPVHALDEVRRDRDRLDVGRLRDLLARELLDAVAHGEDGHQRAHAHDHAERGEDRAEGIRAQRQQPDAQGFGADHRLEGSNRRCALYRRLAGKVSAGSRPATS